MKTLTRLQRFRNLSEKNKRKLYLTIVRLQLLYPIIPLNSISKTAHKKLQKVQNKALRFIENTTLNDRIPSTTLHARNKLPTINTYLHSRGINVWTQPRIIWQTLSKWRRPTKTFQISLNFSDNEFTRTPTNIYINKTTTKQAK